MKCLFSVFIVFFALYTTHAQSISLHNYLAVTYSDFDFSGTVVLVCAMNSMYMAGLN